MLINVQPTSATITELHSLKLVINNCKKQQFIELFVHSWVLLPWCSRECVSEWVNLGQFWKEYEYPNKMVNGESVTNLLDKIFLIGWGEWVWNIPFLSIRACKHVPLCVSARQLLTNFYCYYLFSVSSLFPLPIANRYTNMHTLLLHNLPICSLFYAINIRRVSVPFLFFNV